MTKRNVLRNKKLGMVCRKPIQIFLKKYRYLVGLKLLILVWKTLWRIRGTIGVIQKRLECLKIQLCE